MKRDFLHISDFTSQEILDLISFAAELKIKLKNKETFSPFEGHSLAMIFAKQSARTRVSFETGFNMLGGHAVYLSPDDISIGKREEVKDIARVLSGYNDMIMARLFDHQHIIELAEFSNVPVINGLTDYNHPCQIMADIFTIFENRDNLDDLKIVYVGDGNNIVHSWIHLATRIPLHFTCICPEGFEPDKEAIDFISESDRSTFELSHDPINDVVGADIIYTDVWASMGQKDELNDRKKIFAPFQVNSNMLKSTGKKTLFMHCLPAERGREVTDNVIESTNSIVFNQAENRMHMQNAIMVMLAGKM